MRLGDDGRYHWHWDPAFRARTRDLDERHVRLEACARNLDLPTLLVRGGLSDILTEEGAAEFLELCPGAEYVNIPGAAHMVAGDRNDVFGEAVVDFLCATSPSTGPPRTPRRTSASRSRAPTRSPTCRNARAQDPVAPRSALPHARYGEHLSTR